VLLGTPKPFEAATGVPVTVDLVSSEEAPPETAKPPEPPKPKPQAETPPPLLIPPRPTTVTQSTISNETVPASPQTPASAPKPSAAQPQPPKPPPSATQQQQQPQQRAAAAPPEPATQPQRHAAAPPNPGPPPPAQLDAPTSIFDPAAIPKLLDMTPTAQAPAPAPGFDALADVAAALSRQEVMTFKAHLKKCLKLPEGVDAARELKVVMRVFLRPDGALAAAPMLVAAPAAREGPAMVKAATQAFKACQPYELPAEKYNDWKVLDISLSPRDMAGG
jgi:hypothetical protein